MNFFKKEKQPGAGFDTETFDDSQLPLQLKRIIDHLGFLEKKIDMLLEQSRPRQAGFRPPFGNRGFSGARGNFRPNREGFSAHREGGFSPRPGGHSGRPGGHSPRPGGHSGRPFQKRHTPHQGHQGPSSHTV